MKGNQRNSITTFLLVVGVLFILVAGGIFVTTAWQYLPEVVKQFALLGVSLGAFVGAHVMGKNEKLEKASRAVFYLGVAFVGFFVIAFLGGMTGGTTEMNAFKMLVANILMMLPVVIKWMAEKHAVEFAILSVLVDSMLFCGCVALNANLNAYLVTQAAYTLVLALVDSGLQKEKKYGEALELCAGIVYLIHIICFAVLTFGYVLIDDVILLSVLFPGVVVAATAISWNARQKMVIRICNSLAILWFVFVVVYKVFFAMDSGVPVSVMWLLLVVINAMLMVWMDRGEIMVVQIIAAVIIPYMQLFWYWIEAWDLFSGMNQEWSTIYYPYSFVYAIAFFVWYILKNGSEDILTDWQYDKNLKFAALQMLNGIILCTVSQAPRMMTMAFFLLGAITMLTAASFMEQDAAKKIFKTIAMFAGITAAFCQPFLEIPGEYIVEWGCLWVTIGIVLFRFVWYDEKEQFSIPYFVTTCIMLGVLLLHNLVVEGIGNVLILGLTGIAMLVVAAIMNNRKYVVAASVTLIILVFYLTKEFWLSIAWWVYLFVAGVVLVLLAIKKEKDA